MRFFNEKSILLKFCFYFVVAIILSWPFFIKAQSVVLNAPAASCIVSAGQVNLTWSSDVVNPSYYILSSTTDEATSTIAGPISDIFFTDNNIVSDKTYFYQIRADSATSTYFSNEVEVLPLYCPAVLYVPTASCQADGPHISLNWSSASGNIARYEIYRDAVKIGETVNTNFDDNQNNNLEGTINYSYFIKTVWQDGHSDDSQTAQIQALACPPILNINSSDCATEAPGGPRVSLSWNNLLGVQNYQIYRKAQPEANFSLLTTVAGTNYIDNLVESLSAYGQGGQVSYYVKAIWLTDQKDSTAAQTNISRCAPYLTVEAVCNSSGLLNPEMRLSWTKTQSTTLYNIYRDGSFYIQITNPSVTTFIDYLAPSPQGDCSNKICTHSYKVEAIVTGFPNFPSNQVTKNIDCSTPIPPSPAPVLNTPSAYCVSGDSRISLSWTPSDNIVYYTLYRNDVGIINLLETSYEDSGVQGGYDYTFRVTAFGKGGTFADSPNTQTITAVDCTSPSASTLTATPDCENGAPLVNLSWTGTSNTEAYEIWRGPSAASLSFLTTFDKTAPEYTSRTWEDRSVSPGTTYYYKVVSKGPTGVPPTNSVNTPNVTTSSCLPTAPSLTITPACQSGNSVMNLSWTDGGVNTAYYEIFRLDYMGGSSPYQTILNPRTTSWRDTGVLPGVNYTYKIDAIGFLGNRVGQGWQSPKQALNCAPPGPFTLNAPSTYCQGSYPQASLSWSASSNATSYDLIRSVSNPFTFSGLTATSFTDWGLGNALSFNVASPMGAYVNLGNPAIPLTGNLTIEFWANPSNLAYGNQNPICKSYYNEFCLMMNLDSSLTYRHGANSSRYISFSVPNVFANNNWVHVVITRDTSTRTLIAYKNGVPVNSTTWTSAYDPTTSVSSLYIGRGNANIFRGIIDEVRLYNRVLGGSEVQQHYQGIFSNESNLIGLWHFDEGSGSSASDSSNYGDNGTLTNGPVWVQNGLQWQSQYRWQARAIGPGGSTLSNTTNSYTMSVCLPTKPGLVFTSFCSVGLVNMTLSWSFSTKTIRYEIYRQSTGLIKTINQGDPEFSSRTWTDTNNGAGLTEQTSYTYYVKAIGPTGLQNQSDSISNTTPSCLVPPAPQNLTATFTCCSSATGGTCGAPTSYRYPRVNLTWDASAGATSYSIYRKVGAGSYSLLATTALTSYSNTYSSVTVDSDYSYYVVAYGPGGASLPSTEVSTTTGYCLPSIPSISSITTACESNGPANTISWSDNTPFNVFTYGIYRNTSATIPATPIITIASTTPEFTLRVWKDSSGLATSTQYYYWVRATGPIGNGTSSSRNITTLACGVAPAAPTLNLGSIYCQNNVPYVDLSWNSVAGAYYYNLYRTNPDASEQVFYTSRSPFTDNKDNSYSLNFNGTTNQYVNVGTSDSLLSYGNPVTISVWVYPRTLGSGSAARILSRRGTSDSGGCGLQVSANNAFQFGCDGSTSMFRRTVANALTLNAWQHVLMTWDGGTTATNIHIFVNGIESSYSASSNGSNLTDITGQPTRIGNRADGTRTFNGYIDEVLIYNRALSGSEIGSVYQGTYDNIAGLVGVWHFDEGTGAAAYDQSGNSNHGTLNNNPTWQKDWPSVLTILPLENLRDYKYKVKAFGIDTESDFSNEISLTTPSCLPAKPDLTVASQCQQGNAQLFLDWSDDPNTLYWSIYKKRVEEPYSFLTDISPPQTDFTDINVESGIDYEYYLVAVGQGANTISDAVSETVSFCAPAPSKPIISVTPVCYGYTSRMKIGWQSDPTGRTITYNIWRRNVTLGELDFTKIFSDLPNSATQYLDTVTEGQNYIYEVEAVGSGGSNTVFSDPSNEITSYECTKLPPFPPTLNLNLVYSVDHNVAVSIGWTDAGNEENYKVFRRFAGESEFAQKEPSFWQKILAYLLGRTSLAAYEYPLSTLDADILNYVDYVVTDGQTYEYQVMASNVNGQTFSNIIQVAVPIARPGEFTLSALRLTDLRVYLTWSEALTSQAGGLVTYDILRSNSSDFSSSITICTDVIDPRECVDNNPVLFATVYYKAVATNNGGVTESNVIKVGLPIPFWKEILPW